MLPVTQDERNAKGTARRKTYGTLYSTLEMSSYITVWSSLIVKYGSTGCGYQSARGQLNRKNYIFPVPVRAREFGLDRRVRPSRPASVRLFSTLRLNLVVTHWISPAFRDGVHLLIPSSAIGSVSNLRIRSRNCVPIAFIAERPPAQRQ